MIDLAEVLTFGLLGRMHTLDTKNRTVEIETTDIPKLRLNKR